MSVQTRPGTRFICEVPDGHEGFFVEGPDACGDPSTYICAYCEERDSLLVFMEGLGGKFWTQPPDFMRATLRSHIHRQIRDWHLAHPDYSI